MRSLSLLSLALLGCLTAPSVVFENPCDPYVDGDCGVTEAGLSDAGDATTSDIAELIEDTAVTPPIDAGPPTDQGAAPDADPQTQPPIMFADEDGDGWADDEDLCELADLSDESGARLNPCGEIVADLNAACGVGCVAASRRFDVISRYTAALSGFAGETYLASSGAFGGGADFTPLRSGLVKAAFNGALSYYLSEDWLFVEHHEGARGYATRPEGALKLKDVIPGDGVSPWLRSEGGQRWRYADGAWRVIGRAEAMAQDGAIIWFVDGSSLYHQEGEAEPTPIPSVEMAAIAPISGIKPLAGARLLIFGAGIALVDLSAGLDAPLITTRAYSGALMDAELLSSGEWIGLTTDHRLMALAEGGGSAAFEPLGEDGLSALLPEIRGLRRRGVGLELATAGGLFSVDELGVVRRASLPMIDATPPQEADPPSVIVLDGFSTPTLSRLRDEAQTLLSLNNNGEARPSPADSVEPSIGRLTRCSSSRDASGRLLCVFEAGYGWFGADDEWKIYPSRGVSGAYRFIQADPVAEEEALYLVTAHEFKRAEETHPGNPALPWDESAPVTLDAEIRAFSARDEHVWLGTTKGLLRYKGTTGVTFELEPDRDEPVINAMAFAPDGTLWLGTSYGLYRLDPDGHSRAYIPEALPRREVHDLRWVEGLGLVIADDAGAAILTEGRVYRAGYVHGLLGQRGLQIITTTSGALWIRSEHGLARIDAAALQAWQRGG